MLSVDRSKFGQRFFEPSAQQKLAKRDIKRPRNFSGRWLNGWFVDLLLDTPKSGAQSGRKLFL